MLEIVILGILIITFVLIVTFFYEYLGETGILLIIMTIVIMSMFMADAMMAGFSKRNIEKEMNKNCQITNGIKVIYTTNLKLCSDISCYNRSYYNRSKTKIKYIAIYTGTNKIFK